MQPCFAKSAAVTGLALVALYAAACRSLGPPARPPLPAPETARPPSPCLPEHVRSPREFADAFARHLRRQVLPFWTAPCVVDTGHGGFLIWFDADGNPSNPDAAKPLISQLRMLFVHAVAIQFEDDDKERARIRRQYDQGFDFVRTHYLDTDGAWVAEVRRDGTVRNVSKQTVVQAYVVYVMSELWRRLSDSRARDLALATFAWMDANAHDARWGGYLEAGDLPVTDPKNSHKSIGTQLHVMLALARLFPMAPTARHRERLEEMVDLLLRHVDPDPHRNPPLVVTRDWQPARSNEGTEDQQTLYGHTAEMVWYMLDALGALGRSPAEARAWITGLADGVIRNGLMPDGGVHVWGPPRGPGRNPDDIRWWPQTEAMIMLARLFRLTEDERYQQWFERVTRFTFSRLVPDTSGAWLGGVNRTTGERLPRGGWAWKSGLHVVRALLECDQALRSRPAPWPAARTPRAEPRRAAQLEPAFTFSDVSPAFQKAFQQGTRRTDFPDFNAPGSPRYYETDWVLFQDFVEFRIRSIVDFQREVLDGDDGFRALFPNAMFATWTIALAEGES